ncbi:MAG: beta-lactamase family protein [Candidatus Heimdallarchaeota archaeon]|nr:beta-lactamase family protein [Candidatus Heimdallarchaeota archaeon]MDH5646339.1 beta-lactamase family protein [Candidatus Heimdallarchaeota archaeon]
MNNIDNKIINQISTYLQRVVPFGFNGVFLLAKNDQILFHQGFGYRNIAKQLPMSLKTSLGIGSISKQFTSALIMKLSEKGLLQTGDRLVNYFRNFSEDKQNITIHQLLTHTSGLPSDIDGVDDFTPILTDDFLKKVNSLELRSSPGTVFRYSNIGYSILAILISKLVGKSFQKYLLDDILAPLDIHQVGWFGDPKWTIENSSSYYNEGKCTGSPYEWDGSWQQDYWGILGNGGLILMAEDLYKWMLHLFSNKFLNSNSMNTMLTPELNDYGYGWDVTEDELGKVIMHDGGSTLGINALAKYYPKEDIYYILLGNTRFDRRGVVFHLDPVIKSIFMNKYVQLPPKVEYHSCFDYSIAQQNYRFNIDSDNFGQIITNNENAIVISLNGQQIINNLFFSSPDSILQIDQIKHYNERVINFGKYCLNQDWQAAFLLMKNPLNYEHRVDILEHLLQSFTSQNGEIVNLSTTTIPSKDYFATTYLGLISTKKTQFIAFVWEKPGILLGFRPGLTDWITSFICYNTVDNKIIGYNIATQFQFEALISDNILLMNSLKIPLEIEDNNKFS